MEGTGIPGAKTLKSSAFAFSLKIYMISKLIKKLVIKAFIYLENLEFRKNIKV
jgi:hypothetical protein